MNSSKVTIYETLNNNKQTYAVTKEDLVKSHDLHMLIWNNWWIYHHILNTYR